jgi:hypothetical protein
MSQINYYLLLTTVKIQIPNFSVSNFQKWVLEWPSFFMNLAEQDWDLDHHLITRPVFSQFFSIALNHLKTCSDIP